MMSMTIPAFVINRRDRPDRLGDVLSWLPDWPLGPARIVEAMDSIDNAPPPDWWLARDLPPGAWGCLQSHLAILDAAGDGPVAIFEDDATPAFDDWPDRIRRALSAAPSWRWLYLAGVPRWRSHNLASGVGRVSCVGTTVAYIIRGRAIRAALEALATVRDNPAPIDYVFMRAQRGGRVDGLLAVCPLLFHGTGRRSDIAAEADPVGPAVVEFMIYDCCNLKS